MDIASVVKKQKSDVSGSRAGSRGENFSRYTLINVLIIIRKFKSLSKVQKRFIALMLIRLGKTWFKERDY
jgi:hypothetical protein